MLPSLGVLAFGFLLGMRHATDADHIVAVAALVSRERSLRRAAVLGGMWGLGHTITVAAVGGMLIIFKVVMPPWVGLSLELLVALMLIGLGFVCIAGEGGGDGRARFSRPFLVGTVHGMAGSAAFTLLALPLIASPAVAVGYLLLFGAGTVVGMMAVTLGVAVPWLYAGPRMARCQATLRRAAGAASIAFGLYLAHQIGFGDGLFVGNATWTPK